MNIHFIISTIGMVALISHDSQQTRNFWCESCSECQCFMQLVAVV